MLLQVTIITADLLIIGTSPSDRLLSGCLLLQFEAKKRVSAEEAITHSYFRSLGEEVQTLADSEFKGHVMDPDWIFNSLHI